MITLPMHGARDGVLLLSNGEPIQLQVKNGRVDVPLGYVRAAQAQGLATLIHWAPRHGCMVPRSRHLVPWRVSHRGSSQEHQP